ncbi:type II toxin-antitoxin system Phd/YefM family antitoxin [Corynebacterium callunae]|uniref:type II toxin-antitoxin system Phd/YefM family antitoxin n=1 Tax=Corynebacterium callunae TaxID=1721 RepID=UPI0039823491
MRVKATTSQFRNEQSRYLDIAQRVPVAILSRGTRPRAVVVSPEFYERAMRALEHFENIQAAEAARTESGEISNAELKAELGID